MKMNKTLYQAKALGFYINLLRLMAPKKATTLAYKFFSQPRKGKIDSQSLPPILTQAEVSWVKLQAQQFPIYTWKGTGKTVLLVHGWESNASRWLPFINVLQKENFHILALDAPAHGQATGKAFNIPLYAEYIHKVVSQHPPDFIIGHSIGATACLLQQHQYTNSEVAKMVLLGPASTLKSLLKNYTNLLGLNPKMTQLLETYFRQHFAIDIETFAGHLFSKTLKIPGLVIHDEEDPVVHITESEKIAQHWSNATFKKTKGLGHSMHHQKLYEEIIHFLLHTN